jgi:hypothetical protein
MPIGNYNNIGGFYQQPSNTQNLDSAYQEILKMRATPYNNYRTVFNDISDEWTACSEEERKFIEQDREYAQANFEYAQQFNAFLIDQFGLQFANSKYGSSAEKVLLSMKNARSRFRTSTIEDVNRIKNENAALQRQIKELEEMINGQ